MAGLHDHLKHEIISVPTNRAVDRSYTPNSFHSQSRLLEPLVSQLWVDVMLFPVITVIDNSLHYFCSMCHSTTHLEYAKQSFDP